MKLIFVLLGLPMLLFGATACQTDGDALTSEAMLLWTGPIAADGCGYFLEIDGQEYKPSNEDIIPESFQQRDSSAVVVTYRWLKEPQEYTCGMLPTRHSSTLEIISIEQRQ